MFVGVPVGVSRWVLGLHFAVLVLVFDWVLGLAMMVLVLDVDWICCELDDVDVAV